MNMKAFKKPQQILHSLLLFNIILSGSSIQQNDANYCGNIQTQTPFSNSSILDSMVLCISHNLYLRSSLGLFHVSSLDNNGRLLTITHSSCSSLQYVSPLAVTAGFPSPPEPNSLVLFNCSSRRNPLFPIMQNCRDLYKCGGAVSPSSKTQEENHNHPHPCVVVEDLKNVDKDFHPEHLNCSHFSWVHRSASDGGHDQGFKVGPANPRQQREMEALLCRKLGDPTVCLEDNDSPIVLSKNHPIPQLDSPTAVRVRIKATSLNFANYLQILGTYQEKPSLPFIPGSDFSGYVDAVGPKVSNFRVGDSVCSFAGLGSFAQFIVVDESQLFRVPPGCDLVAAGALAVAFGTSHVALVHRAQLTSGQVLLVLGAAGGVGLAAVQIGKVCGATVIAVARGAEKVQLLKSLGVDHVVDLGNENVTESVKKFLQTRRLKGVDVLYDPVGGKLTKESLRLLKWGANILIIGFASGEIPVIPVNIALVKNWTVHGLYWGSYKIHRPGVLEDSVKELLSWLARGLISIHISHSYPPSEVNLAFSAIKDRKVIGKVMVVFDEKHSRSKL